MSVYSELHGARERLCRLQVRADEVERKVLGDVIEAIDRAGVMLCPQWSKYDEPPLPEVDAVKRSLYDEAFSALLSFPIQARSS